MRLLDCLALVFRPVCLALEVINPGYERKALQLLQGEDQGAVHHAMDHQTMLLRVDVRRFITVRRDPMKRGRCDDPYGILKRSIYVKAAAKGRVRGIVIVRAHRVHETGTPAIGAAVSVGYGGGFGPGCLGARRRNRSHGHTGQRGAFLQEPPSVLFLGVHVSLLWELGRLLIHDPVHIKTNFR